MQYNADESLNVFLNGRVKIIQRRDGYRINEDSLRLCHLVRPMPQASGIDLGAGCGVVAIVLVLENKVNNLVALELQESLADLARRNVVLNGLEDRVEVRRGDIRLVDKMFEKGSFQLAVSNPPYRRMGTGRLGPSEERTIAKHEQLCSLQDLVRAASYLLQPEGIFAFCHLGERWEEIAGALERHGFILSHREDVGELVLVKAMRNRVRSKQ